MQKSVKGWQIVLILFLVIMPVVIVCGVVYYRKRYGRGFWDYYMPKD